MADGETQDPFGPTAVVLHLSHRAEHRRRMLDEMTGPAGSSGLICKADDGEARC